MRVVSGFVKQVEQLLQGVGIVANVPNDGVQAVENLVGVFGQQPFGVLIEHLQGISYCPACMRASAKLEIAGRSLCTVSSLVATVPASESCPVCR